MRLRPYRTEDFARIQTWIADERAHALWCANRMRYPLEKEDFETRVRAENTPLTAEKEDGRPVGFCCYHLSEETGEALLKFVVVDPACRGQGFGRDMLTSAVARCFEDPAVRAVHLNVFSSNEPALRCYRRVGFSPRSVTENAFSYRDEAWDRCNLVIRRDNAAI